jgi:membrane-bound metal-dependent hydrolase YbcI (DUF457 family)
LDNLTHSLFGLTLARTPLGRAGQGTTAALLLASNAPDIDIVTTAGGAASYLHWHRGPTHGPLGVVGLGLVTAVIVWLGVRIAVRRRRPTTAHGREAADASPPATFLMLWAIAILGVACHVLMDLPTAYGTRPLSPFDWHWYAEDWMPIVDVYLWAVLAAGLWFGSRQRRPGARERNAAIVLVLMGLNYGLRGVSHHEALVRAPEAFGPLLPERCGWTQPQGWIDRWPRPTTGQLAAAEVQRSGATAAPEDGRTAMPERCLVEIAAQPDFLSPFRWRLVAQLSDAYELHQIDLLTGQFGAAHRDSSAPWRLSDRYPNQWTPAVVKASAAPVAQVFLGFSRFPAARSLVEDDGSAIVRWADMRFVSGERPPRPTNLFSVRVRLAPDGRVVEQKLGP